MGFESQCLFFHGTRTRGWYTNSELLELIRFMKVGTDLHTVGTGLSEVGTDLLKVGTDFIEAVPTSLKVGTD